MKLNKVKIGETEYFIKYVNKINDIIKEIDNKVKLRTEILGLCYPRNGFWEPGKIVVKISDDAEKTADTVFHEITHAMFAEMMNQHPEYQKKLSSLYSDEFFIQKFSELLRDVLESMKVKKEKKKVI